jgi:hypothetical protein
LNNVEQCSHRVYYDDDIIYSANEYYIFGIVLAVLAFTALNTVVQTVRADDAHASPPLGNPQATNPQGYINGVAEPCDASIEGVNAPPSNSDGEEPGNSIQNPVFSHCD